MSLRASGWIAKLTALALLAAPGQGAAQLGGWTARLVGPGSQSRLASPEAEVRLGAVRTLARRGEHRRAVSALLAALESEEDVRVRRAIFAALARRGDESTVSRLAERLPEWSREDRVEAIRTLGAVGGEAAIRSLTEWLGAADVGDEAVDALVRIGVTAVPHLLRALAVPVAVARASRALGRIGDARAVAPLASQLGVVLPAVRVEMLDALGAIRDERAGPAVAAALEDPAPPVVAAALGALSRLGGPDLAEPVAALADRGATEQRALALGALAIMDPARAAPRLEAALAADVPPLLRRAAIDALLEHPSAPVIAPLRGLIADPEHRVAAAEALARVPDGAGLASLLAASRGGEAPRLHVALALAVRRHGEVAGVDDVDSARELLRRDGSARGLALSALARDERVLEELTRVLEAPDHPGRQAAAVGLLLLEPRTERLRGPLRRALERERDDASFRVLALAALAAGARVDPARLEARWWNPATAPEVLWLAAKNLGRASPRTRGRVRRAMRRALRAGQPRVRAGAALALALAAETGAWRALLAALEDEHDAVRLAAARALAALSVDEARDGLRARLRVEPDPRVRATLRRAIDTTSRPVPAFARGRETLFVRVATAPGLETSAEGLAVDLLLPDGRWLRMPALADGEVLVPGLPAGEAEVQVLLGNVP